MKPGNPPVESVAVSSTRQRRGIIPTCLLISLVLHAGPAHAAIVNVTWDLQTAANGTSSDDSGSTFPYNFQRTVTEGSGAVAASSQMQ